MKISEIITDKYKLRMPPTVYYDLLADVREVEEEQEPKFIAKSDGTIEQIKNCNDCLFKKKWEKIGKLLSVVLEKQTEQAPKTGHWIDCDNSDDYSADGYDCSVCGVNAEYATSYCPNCGAKMVEPQESEDKE